MKMILAAETVVELKNVTEVKKDFGKLAEWLEGLVPKALDLILEGQVDLVIDTPSQGVEHSKDGFLIRRNAIETGVNVLTAIDTAEALVTSLESTDKDSLTLVNIADI